ncbi:hypothetical protein [Kitasatospora sp. NPDC059571]|uniref:hypothetical protein n=1 Tax=Kitasatospora sp. NPDC059571 TaxID=3346871 RepID=UPI0036C1A900
MTEDAGGGQERTEGWNERLGWVFGLVADNAEERLAALRHHTVVKGLLHDAWARSNELWHVTRPLGPDEQYREPAFARAREAVSAAGGRVLPDALWKPYGTNVRTWPGLPYALLFLEWEARYPHEWTAHAKAWGAKESLLRQLSVDGHDEATVRKLTDLVMVVVERPYRCKDREYVRVARAVDNPGLRRRLATAAASDDAWARTHAEYVLWVLDRPGMRIRRRTWTDWLIGSLHAKEAQA